MKTRIPRNQTVSDRSINPAILIRSPHSANHSTPVQILLHIELVRLPREDRVVVVRVQHRHRHARRRRLRGGAVVRGRHHQVVPVGGLAVQRAAQVDPAAVREDAEDVRAVLWAGFARGEQAVGQPGVVTGVQVDRHHLEDLQDNSRRWLSVAINIFIVQWTVNTDWYKA